MFWFFFWIIPIQIIDLKNINLVGNFQLDSGRLYYFLIEDQKKKKESSNQLHAGKLIVPHDKYLEYMQRKLMLTGHHFHFSKAFDIGKSIWDLTEVTILELAKLMISCVSNVILSYSSSLSISLKLEKPVIMNPR